MANWESFRVVDIISEIDEEKYVLPVMQRELVWSMEKMELLFDSLLKSNSFGSIIVIEEGEDSPAIFASRPFTKDGTLLPSQNKKQLTQKQYFVIDGQQRLQSFYIGLKGSYKGKILFFDLFSDYSENFEFQFANEIQKLPNITKEERPLQKRLWYSCKDLFLKAKKDPDFDDVSSDIIKSLKIEDEEQKKHIRENIKAFHNNIIVAKTIGVAIVKLKRNLSEVKNRQKMLDLFIRLNDGGTKLSQLDLMASTLKAFDYRMEAFLREITKKFKDINVGPENLIKLIFLLQDDYSKEMSELDESDTDFIIANSERIKNTLLALRAFLNCAMLYDYYKYENRSFIPLFFIAYHIFHSKASTASLANIFDNWETSNSDFKPMKIWICRSLLNGVFRSRGAGWIPYKTGIKKLLNEIKNHKGKVFPDQALFEVYINHPINYIKDINEKSLDSLDWEFFFYFIYSGKPQVDRTNDVDHIMPRNILEKMDYSEDDINSVKNFQLLDYKTNRGIKNGKPFLEWIGNEEYVKDKTTYMETHFIPKDESLWDEKHFLEFSKKRGELIAECINKLL